MQLSEVLQQAQQLTEQHIENYFSQLDNTIAPNLYNAMHYSVMNGGKRVRPFLVFSLANILNINESNIAPAAIALELIHSYSLVHDDLPAMDDDDLRRGKPTCHVQFDEANAILAGDALQPLAFELIANADMPAEIKIRWVKTLSHAAGYKGMCGGQSLDLAAEHQQVSLAELEKIHKLKTGALLVSAVQLVCDACPNLPVEHQQDLTLFAQDIGLAFQVRDDILDIISSTEELGKPQGSDQRLDKSTYPSLLGLEQAQQKADKLYQSALAALDRMPYNTEVLAAFAAYIVNRSK